MGTGGSDRNHGRGIAVPPALAAGPPAFVFGPQLEGGAEPELAAVVRHEAGATLDEWCTATGDPVLAAGIARYLDSGEVPRLWLQAAVTAVQLGVAAALGRRGLAPAAVAGLSMGELAAAVVAGRLDVGDAARVARGVSVLCAAGDGDGRLAVVAASRTTLARVLGADGPALAATLAPRAQVIAGRGADVERVSGELRAAGVEVHELRLPSAFHSEAVEPLRDSFLRQVGAIAPRPGRARLYSGIDASHSPPLDAVHWWNVCRRSFHFDDAIRAMLADGVRWFIEIGPRPVVAGYILAIAADLAVPVRVDSARGHLAEARGAPLRVTGS
jgi:acyl transferase domain-containing protein